MRDRAGVNAPKVVKVVKVAEVGESRKVAGKVGVKVVGKVARKTWILVKNSDVLDALESRFREVLLGLADHLRVLGGHVLGRS